MYDRAIRTRRRGPGRPKTRDTVVITLNLDRKAIGYLIELSEKYGIPRNQVVEELLFGAVNDHHQLELKRKLLELRQEVKRLTSELEILRNSCNNAPENPEIKKIKKLKEKAHWVLERHGGELKVFELVKKVFGIKPGDQLHHVAREFIDEYFIDNGKELVSRELELKIIKNPGVGIVGWQVRKLDRY